MRFGSLARCALVLSFCVAPASAGVIRVDALGSGDFTEIQAAVDAAAPGDIVLVKPTAKYGEVLVSGKGIVLSSDSPVTLFETIWTVTIESVPAGQSVVLRGARIWGGTTKTGLVGGLTIRNCAGGVLVEDCLVSGPAGYKVIPNAFPGRPGIHVETSTNVSIARSWIGGGNGLDGCGCGPQSNNGTDGGPGLSLLAAHVALHENTLRGGVGGKAGFMTAAGKGGVCATLKLSTLHGFGTFFDGNFAFGYALVVDMPVGPIPLLDCALVGNAPVVVDPQNVVQIVPGTVRRFAVSSPAREQQPVALQIDGESGELALLFIGAGVASTPVPGIIGLLHASLPLQGPFVFGTLPAPNGVLPFSTLAPDLVLPSLLGFTSILQPVLISGGEARFATPSAFVLVDASL